MPDRPTIPHQTTTMPIPVFRGALFSVVALLATSSPAAQQASGDPARAGSDEALVLFRAQVRELLIHQCLKCHGGQAPKGDFSLATREALLESGVVDFMNVGESRLLALVRHEDEPHMPKNAPRLSDAQIQVLERWLALGAPYEGPLVDPHAAPDNASPNEVDRSFWSFQPLVTQGPPAVEDDAGWTRTAIDRFILAKQQEVDLAPNAVADRRVLIRRATFDLTGLPPSPEAVEVFVTDPDPAAYERLIDSLLDSPHYGERWARHWMDVTRFAESHGYEQDYDRGTAFYYRDFLIRALNDDMPYDQFVGWQLAGDELAPEDPLAWMATGFLSAGAFPTQLTEAEFESARYDELDDMISTTGSAFLGLTIGCARCHDHKYDPIAARDYYRLVASFATAIRSEVPFSLQSGEDPVPVQVTSENVPLLKHNANDRGFPHFYPQVYFLTRGDVRHKQEVAPQGFLPVLMRNGTDETCWQRSPPDGSKTSHRRAALARWITDTQDGAGHLAARVIANRLWYHHFGQGIVATPNDFGLQGDRPAHPELLDWLAVDLVHHGWRLKRMHKLIMSSAVYMQSTDDDERRSAIDPENRWWWRRTPRRLEGEAIRDALLAASGQLDSTMYGPGSLDENMKRRSVYFFIKRSKLIPSMMLFDWPEHLVSIGRRSQTTTAPQALAFMNSPQGRGFAEALAASLTDLPVEQAVPEAYRRALGRTATAVEVQLALEFIRGQREAYADADGDAAIEARVLADFCQALMSSNEFVYVD